MGSLGWLQRAGRLCCVLKKYKYGLYIHEEKDKLSWCHKTLCWFYPKDHWVLIKPHESDDRIELRFEFNRWSRGLEPKVPFSDRAEDTWEQLTLLSHSDLRMNTYLGIYYASTWVCPWWWDSIYRNHEMKFNDSQHFQVDWSAKKIIYLQYI